MLMRHSRLSIPQTKTARQSWRWAVNKAVSDYMRDMQRRSARSRWNGLSAAEKSAAMKALRAKGKRKPKRVARRSNSD